MKSLLHLSLALMVLAAGQAGAGPFRLLSTALPGPRPSVTANGDSGEAAFSRNGRFVVFVSAADNLVTNCHNGLVTDIFVRDLVSGDVTLVSVTPDGLAGGNASSLGPSISGDGRYVAFESRASNLVADDTNGVADIFLRDLETGMTTQVSRRITWQGSGRTPPGDSARAVITADGNRVFFDSADDELVIADTNQCRDVFMYERGRARIERVSLRAAIPDYLVGGGDSYQPVPDATGNRVLFRSSATNLAPAADLSGSDLYLRDLKFRITKQLGAPEPPSQYREWQALDYAISDDGRYVSAGLGAAGRAIVVWRDLFTPETIVVTDSIPARDQGEIQSLRLSADGQRIAISWREGYDQLANAIRQSTNAIWLWQYRKPAVPLAVGPDGDAPRLRASQVALSPAGDRIAFRLDVAPGAAGAPELQAGAVYERGFAGGPLRLILPASDNPQFSADGRQVVAEMTAADVVPDDRNAATDLMVRNLDTDALALVSRRVGPDSIRPGGGTSGVGPSVMTPDGRYLAFTSLAADLVTGDTNRRMDVFLHDLQTGITQLISVNRMGTGSGNGASHSPVLSADGRYVAFLSRSSDLVANDTNTVEDVYLRDVAAGTTTVLSVGPLGVTTGGWSRNLSLSADGGRVAFESNGILVEDPLIQRASVQAYLWDRGSGRLTWASAPGEDGVPVAVQGVTLSADGSHVGFVNTAMTQAFVREITSGRYLPVNLPTPGAFRFAGLVLGPDARHFVTRLVSPPVINPVPPLAVLHDATGAAAVLSVTTEPGGPALSGDFADLAFSANGRFVVFSGLASPPGDTNRTSDVFLHDLQTRATTLISVNRWGTSSGNGASRLPQVNHDGTRVVFQSQATDLVPDDTNGVADIFVRDVRVGVTRRMGIPPALSGGLAGPACAPLLARNVDRVVAVSFGALNALPIVPPAGQVGVADFAAEDQDANRLDDDWERAHFGVNGVPADADPDGDGSTTAEEFAAGTSPVRADSRLWVAARQDADGEVRVGWPSVFGLRYAVEYRDDLSATNNVLSPGVTGTGGWLELSATNFPAGPVGWFRVRLAP